MTTNALLISIPEACTVLGIGRSSVYELMAGGALPSVKVGRRRLIPAQALDAYVSQLIDSTSQAS